MRDPLISVVMPVFNAGRFLKEAIESILTQSLGDYEFIIIDDGSTDDSRAVIEHFCQLDERIHLINQPKNLGIVPALNRGLDASRGKYIARMDADDISLPERFKKQVDYLEMHPLVGILGTAILRVDEEGKPIHPWYLPLDDLSIRWESLLETPFAHPAVMMRRQVLTENHLHYAQEARNFEDYELWVRLLGHTRGANLAERLVKRRVHPQSIVSQFNSRDFENLKLFIYQHIREAVPNLSIGKDSIDFLVDVRSSGLRGALRGQRAKSAAVYLQLWDCFAESNKNDPALGKVKKVVIQNAAILSLIPAFQDGRWVIYKELSKRDGYWFFRFIAILPGKILKRLLSRNSRLSGKTLAAERPGRWDLSGLQQRYRSAYGWGGEFPYAMSLNSG